LFWVLSQRSLPLDPWLLLIVVVAAVVAISFPVLPLPLRSRRLTVAMFGSAIIANRHGRSCADRTPAGAAGSGIYYR